MRKLWVQLNDSETNEEDGDVFTLVAKTNPTYQHMEIWEDIITSFRLEFIME